MEIFEKANLGSCELKNRIIRSATFEGMSDKNGFPQSAYYDLYEELARNDVAAIITGFAYISKDGRAMQPGQAGIDSELKIPYYLKLTKSVHKHDCKVFLQIAHTGRQTKSFATGADVVSSSPVKSFYFGEKPRELNKNEILAIIEKFGDSALFAKRSGFDGVQIHAAHGYLIHQFILRSINKRKDEFGIDPDTGIGTKFLELIIDNIRKKCGQEYTVLIKISGADDYYKKFSSKHYVNLIKFLGNQKIDGIEISYGTMDYAFNIFRGDIPTSLILDRNPIFKTNNSFVRFFRKLIIIPAHKLRIKAFTPAYNLSYASIAKKYCKIPVITVGGFRSYEEINNAISKMDIDFVSLCRPLLAEPDFVKKMAENHKFESKCKLCNYCVIMCDSEYSTKCYKN